MEIADLNMWSIIEDRKNKNDKLFFVEIQTVGCEYGFEYIKRKKYYGLRHKGIIVVEPIYDKVLCLSKEVMALWINGKIAVYSIKSGNFISQFDYVEISNSGVYWKLNKESNITTLYDSERSQFLGDYEYSDFGLGLSDSQYFWAKRGKFFHYIKRETGQIISLPGVIMAYDTQYDMFGKDDSGKILCFEESGIENTSKLRTVVSEAGGYLRLTNLALKIEDVIDVYGNKLNI